MNPYVNEDVMFQRLKDIQREAENRRLVGDSHTVLEVAWMLGRRAWLIAGLAMRRPPRRRPMVESDERNAVSDVA